MGLLFFRKNAGVEVFGIGFMHPLDVAQACILNFTLQEIAVNYLKKILKSYNLLAKNLEIIIDEDKALVKCLARNQSEKEKIILIVGNTVGISVVDEDIEVENFEVESQFYTVKVGDSLGKIAKTYYGNPKMYFEIFSANKPMLLHPNDIYAGQVIRIPPKTI